MVPPEALAPFAVPAPPQDPAPLPYLRPATAAARSNYDVRLEVRLEPSSSASGSSGSGANAGTLVASSNLRTCYWTVPQMIAHHTAGGCNLRPGDLLATGTLSSEGPLGAGCLLEAT